MEVPKFANAEEEASFWKAQYEEATRNYEEFKELKEQAEEELENEVMTLEDRALDFEIKYEQEKQDKEGLMIKSREKHEESMKAIARLTEELHSFRSQCEKLSTEKIKLEQENDDLERRERELSASLHDLQERVDLGTEKSVIMNLELEELRVSSQEVIQRLKDEIRDQKHELNIRSLELDALQRQLPRFERKTRMLTPNLSPIGFVNDMLSLVKEVETQLLEGKRI